MNNNVYGIIGIGVDNGNFNADFDKLPKQNGRGEIIASPYALQWTIKKYWEDRDYKVFGLKTENKNGAICGIDDKFSLLFGTVKDKVEIRNSLLSCEDVKNFGLVYAAKKESVAIKGITQISMGVNKYKDANIINETILSPFANNGTGDDKKEKKNTTIGERVITDEAHYIYDFSINPNEYIKYINDSFKGYTEEDYENFKLAALKGVTFCNSKSKKGCVNEFGLFIKIKEEYNHIVGLGNIKNMVDVYKDEETVIYDLKSLSNLLSNTRDKIESIEMYINNYDDKFKITNWDIEDIKVFNIITMEEI